MAKRPVIPWTADNKKLIHDLFDKLDENDTIRKGIWPKKGEGTSGSKQAVHYRNLADKLLKDQPVIQDLLKTDRTARIHYGNAVKSQLARLEKSWRAAKETLGIIGAGLPNEELIGDGPYIIRTKWEEVKEMCPWFYRMRDMVGDRFDDIGAAITDSDGDVTLDPIQSGDRRRTKGPELEEVLNNGEDDEMDDDIEDRDRSPHHDHDTTTIQRSANTYTVPIRTTSPSPIVQPPGLSRRKSGIMSDLTEGLMSDLIEGLKEASAIKNERKKLHDKGIEETKRLEIKEKFRVEHRRLDLEERKMVMEEKVRMRSLALEEKRLAMAMGKFRKGSNADENIRNSG